MELSRRGRATAGCGGALVVAALVLADPLLLAGAAAIGAWLLGCQVSFLRQLAAHRQQLSVTLETDRRQPLVEDQTTVSLRVAGHESLPTRVSARLPAAADSADELTVTATEGQPPTGEEDRTQESATEEQPATALATVTWSVAGSYWIDPPRVIVADPFGLFIEAYQADAALDVTVRARQPGTMHLGSGGERVAAAYGAHTSDQTGPGIEPAELREYQPGDDITQIDWKATARLATPYVTESAAETDRRTVLLLDHRATMGVGRGGVTPIAYLRHAALAIAESAAELGDPLGLYAVGDDGVTEAEPPRATPGQHQSVAASIRALTPTAGSTTVSPEGTATAGGAAVTRSDGGNTASARATDAEPVDRTPGVTPATGRTSTERDAAAATRASALLAADDSQFARTLQPFFEDATPYLHRVESEPLFAAARTYLGRLQGTVWTVLITDDSRRGELRETIRLARRGNDHVLVLLAPRALYEADGLADLDAAYRRYSEFESFRRELAGLERVDVLELAPGDRIEAVLSQAGGERS